MISLKRIVEQQGADGQYYDLGKDFSNFRRYIDGSFAQIKQQFEQTIGAKLNGKRVRARASRGYKQYVKDYEFNVSKITLDDYYDNYVVVAHDNTTPKPKEYFLKPGFKIQILGPASGQPAVGGGTGHQSSPPQVATPQTDPTKAQSEPMLPVTQGKVVKEDETSNVGTGHYDAYPIDTIAQDIEPWLKKILKKPETATRDFIPALGWLKDMGHGKTVALFDLVLPINGVRVTLDKSNLTKLLQSGNRDGTIQTRYELVSAEPDETKEDMHVRVKKIMTDITAPVV